MSRHYLLTKLRHVPYVEQMTEMQTQEQGLSIPTWTLGWRLQRALAHANVSVEQMSAELGISRSTVSRWLNDRGTPSLGYLKLWSMRTRVPLDWLLADEVAGQGVYSGMPRKPAGLSGQPEPGYAEVASPLDEFRKRLPLTQFAALLAVAA